jgi:acetate---CoA ligase (ADP-forming)
MNRGDGWVSAEEEVAILEAFGLEMTPTSLARTEQEAAAAARDFGRPVVAKLRATGLIHKSDVGGVRVGLSLESTVKDAFADLQRSAESHGLVFEGVAIQPMSQGGVEVTVGASAIRAWVRSSPLASGESMSK